MTSSPNTHVADAVPKNWVDRWAPHFARPFLRLARADRPIGTWLLLWPCWWSIALAAPEVHTSWPDPLLLILFAIGAVAMRGAGCTYNDIVDRDFDAQVARTASRPIPSGQVSVVGAWIFLVCLCLIGLMVLLTLNHFAIFLGLASLALVAIYPFMKRVTYWPQAFLGLTFNWGALMGWAAVTGSLDTPAYYLYAGGIAWTLGYDTIYAHQDKEDDALIGVKSTALRLGETTKTWLWGFYGAAFFCFALAGLAQEFTWPFYLCLTGAGAQLVWQIQQLSIDDSANCLRLFRSNHLFGVLVFVSICVGIIVT